MKSRRPYIPRPYQHDHLAESLAGNYRYIALVYGVGGGKTLTSLILVALRLAAGVYSYVIVVVTQRAIAHQFIDYSSRTFEFENQTYPFAPHATKTRQTTGSDLETYVSRENPSKAILVTHYSVLLNKMKAISNALSSGRRICLVIDEGHHVHDVDPDKVTDQEYDDPKANLKVSKAIAALLKGHGDHLWTVKLTGTPYRSDARTVIKGQGLKVFEKRLVHLMLEGYAPKQVVTEYQEVDGDYEVGAKAIANQWVKDGRPSALIRIKPRNQEINEKTIEALKKAFAELTGPKAAIQDVTLEAGNEVLEDFLDKQQSKPTPRAVFLTLQRMVEGVDIPTLTHAYFWGVPRSMLVIEQILGRILRLRVDDKGQSIAGCPPEWVWKSKAVFFFGKVVDQEEGEKDYVYIRMLLRAFVFLSTFEHPIWLARQMLGIEDGLPSRIPLGESADLIDQQLLPLAHEVLKQFYVDWKSRVNTAFSLDPFARDTYKLFRPALLEWYHTKGVRNRHRGDPVLSDDILSLALRRQRLVQLSKEGRNALESAFDSLDDQLIRDVLDHQSPGFRAEYYRDGCIIVDGKGPDSVAEEFGRLVAMKLDGAAENLEDLLPRAEAFRALQRRWPESSDVDVPGDKEIPYSYYSSILRQAGYWDFKECWALTRPEPLELLEVAWRYVRKLISAQVFDLKSVPDMIRNQYPLKGENAFGELYSELLVFGAQRLDWPGPPAVKGTSEEAAQTILRVLKDLKRLCPTKAKLEPVRRAYDKGGFTAVLAWLGRQDQNEAQL